MESIAADFRRGILWVLVPLGAVMLVRLALERGYGTWQFGLLAALVALFGAAHAWLSKRPTRLRIRAALLLNFLGINVGYVTIGVAMNSHAGWRADVLVHGIDRAIFGGDPQRFLGLLSTPWLSTATMLGYLAFAGFLFYLFLSEAFALSGATGRLQLGLMRLYGIGFSGYILLPAAGPAFHHPELLPPIQHSAFSAALAYFDTLSADRLPAALIQGQRDFFGAHTYQRTDRDGAFHTRWAETGRPEVEA